MGALGLSGCLDSNNRLPTYVCANGSPASGTATADNIERCARCDAGYSLVNQRCSPSYQVSCSGLLNSVNVGKTIRCARGNIRYTLPISAPSAFLIAHNGGSLSVTQGSYDATSDQRLVLCPTGGHSMDHDLNGNTAAIDVCPNGQRLLTLQQNGNYTVQVAKGDVSGDLLVKRAPLALFPFNVTQQALQYANYFWSPPNRAQKITVAHKNYGSATLLLQFNHLGNTGNRNYQSTFNEFAHNFNQSYTISNSASAPTLKVITLTDGANPSQSHLGFIFKLSN